MRRIVLVLAIVLTCGSGPFSVSQEKSLRDEVREKGYAKHSWETDLPHLTPHTLESLIKTSDIIVRGQVVNQVTRLTSDERAVMTDYTIEVTDVLKDAMHVVSPGRRLIVSEYGGSTTIEGKPVQFDTPYFAPIPWHESEIFLVAHAPKPNPRWEYAFTFSDIGVWRFKEGKFFCENARKRTSGYTRSFCNESEAAVISDLKRQIEALAGGTK